MAELTISLIHYEVAYRQIEKNRHNLLALITEAAEKGGNIIVTPELALSGYGFTDRNDIQSCMEESGGEFIAVLKKTADAFGCYICVGLALVSKKNGGYHNSAVVVGPGGTYLRYDKINSEIRWAKPGDPHQTACFDTPWGRVGVLICSDSYYGLLPRVAALKGVDLLLIPANWPPTGLDPVELWRARALENGVAIGACNRTGKDRNMDCSQAESCLIDGRGKVLFRGNSSETTIMPLSLPLNDTQLPSGYRKERQKSRRPELYHSCYRRLTAVRDIGVFYDLPSPGLLSVSCCVPAANRRTGAFFSEMSQAHRTQPSETSLWLLPGADYSDAFLTTARQFCKENRVYLMFLKNKTAPILYLFKPDGEATTFPFDQKPDKNSTFPRFDIGPARVAVIPFPDFAHPEIAVAASKEGCDLIIAGAEQFTEEIRLLCGVQTINNLAVALCSYDGAGIWMRPEDHSRWGETLAEPGECCTFLLDTALTRKKRFQDNVDYDFLFYT